MQSQQYERLGSPSKRPPSALDRFAKWVFPRFSRFHARVLIIYILSSMLITLCCAIASFKFKHFRAGSYFVSAFLLHFASLITAPSSVKGEKDRISSYFHLFAHWTCGFLCFALIVGSAIGAVASTMASSSLSLVALIFCVIAPILILLIYSESPAEDFLYVRGRTSHKRRLFSASKASMYIIVLVVVTTYYLLVVFNHLFLALDLLTFQNHGFELEINDVPLHFDCTGTTPATKMVFLFSGYGVPALQFSDLARLLATKLNSTICLIDYPGVGMSESSSIPVRAVTMTTVMIELLNEVSTLDNIRDLVSNDTRYVLGCFESSCLPVQAVIESKSYPSSFYGGMFFNPWTFNIFNGTALAAMGINTTFPDTLGAAYDIAASFLGPFLLPLGFLDSLTDSFYGPHRSIIAGMMRTSPGFVALRDAISTFSATDMNLIHSQVRNWCKSRKNHPPLFIATDREISWLTTFVSHRLYCLRVNVEDVILDTLSPKMWMDDPSAMYNSLETYLNFV